MVARDAAVNAGLEPRGDGPPVINAHGQPVGADLAPPWQPPPWPPREPLQGRWCTLEPLDAHRHGPSLVEAAAAEPTGASWTYLPYGPFASPQAHLDWLRDMAGKPDPQFFAIVDAAGCPVGVAAYMRIEPRHGVIEIGHLHFSPALQRTPAATEALSLLIGRAIELGYRRVEWKCDSHNAPSRRAAERLGFRFEGIFRQHMVIKGRNRDTAWFGLTDGDWARLRPVHQRWLSADNFDAQGRQRTALSTLTRAACAG